MLYDRIFVTLFNSVFETTGTRHQTTFTEFCEMLKVPQVVNITKDEYDKLSPDEQKKTKYGNCYCPAVFDGDIRKGAVNAVGYMIALDADHPTATLIDDMKSTFKDVKMFEHTTFSSREDKPRNRFLIALSRSVSADEYKAIAQEIAKKVNCDFDKACFHINQPILFPRVLKDVPYHCEEWGSNPLDVDMLLETGSDDAKHLLRGCVTALDDSRSTLSDADVSCRGGKISDAEEVRCEVDTGSVPEPYGLIQAWCEAHPIKSVMEEELKEIYEPTDTENRYKFRGADSSPGVVIDVEKNIVTSFHNHDPASGKSYNSFDLYRIHKYGHLDKDCAKGTPKNELPSFKAMMKHIKKDKKAKELLAKYIEKHKPKKAPETVKIMKMLQRTNKGEIKSSVANVSTILLNDPNLKGIYYNSFFGQYEVGSPLPWESGKKYPHPYNDHDRNATISYISKEYEVEVRSCFDTALSEIVFSRAVNPLQQYFEELKWDGTGRVESLLTTYFGCEDSEYTRAAIRTTLIGAVRRVFEPGCKFETVLLILGNQGCGTSTFVSKLGMNYFTDSIRLQDIISKTAAEKLRGVMIVELGEMAGYSKTEEATFKSFISCVDDQYREPYAKCKSSHPRTNIFIGTSNRTTGLLTDETGNRRFLPVYTTDNHTLNSWDMTKEDVDQIWAEAYNMYRSGESTEMPKHLMDEIKKKQDGAVVEDDRAQFISQYLDVMLPEDWYDMDIMKRRDYINHEGAYCGEPYEGTMRRNYVCVAEICTELFKLDKVDVTPKLSKDIALMLRKLGWTEYPYNNSRKKIRGYGIPTTFCRPA